MNVGFPSWNNRNEIGYSIYVSYVPMFFMTSLEGEPKLYYVGMDSWSLNFRIIYN